MPKVCEEPTESDTPANLNQMNLQKKEEGAETKVIYSSF